MLAPLSLEVPFGAWDAFAELGQLQAWITPAADIARKCHERRGTNNVHLKLPTNFGAVERQGNNVSSKALRNLDEDIIPPSSNIQDRWRIW